MKEERKKFEEASKKPEIAIETDKGEISKEELDDIMKKSMKKEG